MGMDGELYCVRCGKAVRRTREYYEVQERMHWLCFHLEYEHEGDPDEPCSDPSCPWWAIAALLGKLAELSYDPDEVVSSADL